jgi:heme/copper-type cytochrome/quinol oxidase subunit 1
MIIFLTLCFVALLFLLVKLRILPDNLFVRLSPIGFMLLLFLFLFVPMQWGAPGGPAVVDITLPFDDRSDPAHTAYQCGEIRKKRHSMDLALMSASRSGLMHSEIGSKGLLDRHGGLSA